MKRLRRIFKADGRTVIVAMDHGMGMNVNPALDKTGEILRAIVAGGADAVLVSYGIAVKYADVLQDVGVIVRCDGGYSAIPSSASGHPRLLYSVEDALRIGADAVACNGFPGTPDEQDCMKNVAALTAQGNAWGVPVMAEMLPGGFGNAVPKTVENVRLAARTGCEYGASIIKTTYTGTPEEFRQVIEASYQPVIVLGGEKTSELPALFECIEKAVSVGAAGVAIGRNVWKHADPEAVTRALVDLVHNGKKASEIQGL
ncbi:class I fructose-bisphosphate aldolase [Pseudoflavonifractor sp. HCP28S3_F10]|uniref:class I fructose-bisphosphate aldolase n=1 Tax=Pseudoflavonifractor sp. HCP28S3_F10 TaxID=3438947 RepID=UPI003F8AF409